MITKLSKIFYMFLVSLLILAVIFFIIQGNIFLDTRIFYLLFLISFPFFDRFIESIKKDLSPIKLSINYGNNLEKYIGIVIVGVVMYFGGTSIYTIAIILFLAFSILFRLDSRIAFIGALILLVLTPLYLIIGDKLVAESLSIFAYYFLIIGVILEIRNQIFPETKIQKEIIQDGEEKNKYSFIDDMFELIGIYIHKIKQKIKKIKNNILEEIGEKPVDNPNTVSGKSIELKNTKKLASKTKNIKQNFYIKLAKYFIKKIQANILGITLFLFILNSVFAILILEYNFIASIIIYSLSLLIISYGYSKTKGVIYDLSIEKSHNIKTLSRENFISKSVTIEDAVLHTDSLSPEEIENISRARNVKNNYVEKRRNAYFFNKAIIFASLGLVAGYFLMQYFKINENSTTVYIAIFSLFFLAYYIIFSDLDSKILGRGKRTGKHIGKTIGNFSLKSFIKKHIYLLLNSLLIITILIVLGFRTGIFATWYKDYKESRGYENWTLVKEKIKELTKEEKERKITEIKQKLSLISGEADIQSLSGALSSTGETISEDDNIKISVKDYYKFKKSLRVGSKTDEVIKLEEIMKKLNYFNGIPDRIFDQKTKTSLTNLLKKECDWPDTTKGILGNQAMQCLYSLEITK